VAELELRTVPPEEALGFVRTAETAFGELLPDEDLAQVVDELYEPGWAIGAYDGPHLVATASALPMELTLPAGSGQEFPVTNVMGVTAVGVLPTHRRRGLLTRMMAHQARQLADHEVPLAVLTASESVIYGRFGYGLACSYQDVAILTRRAAFLPEASRVRGDQGGGRLRQVTAGEAADILPAVHDRARRRRPGEVNRSKSRWDLRFADPERFRGGGGGRMYVIWEDKSGQSQGYAAYRYHQKWESGLAQHKVTVGDLYSTSPEVEAILWRYLLDLDLVAEVGGGQPLDAPLRWLLADPRQLRTVGLYDFLWVLLVDVPAALSSRGYGTETDIVLEVNEASGRAERYHISTGPAGASCRRAKAREKTDLALSLADLGALYLGGCRPSTLAAAGRVHEVRPGALPRADAAFASPVAPFCGTSF